jgi:hypothetical protein
VQVTEWVQAGPITPGDLKNKIVVVEVFQVNCPGALSTDYPKPFEIHNRYTHKALQYWVWLPHLKIMTKHNTENLKLLFQKEKLLEKPSTH